MTPERIAEIRNKLSMAQLANGGSDYREGWCKCDPSVGMAPCEYCAIQEALKRGLECLDEILRLQQALQGVPFPAVEAERIRQEERERAGNMLRAALGNCRCRFCAPLRKLADEIEK